VILNILGALAGFCVWRTLREKYCWPITCFLHW
jgi:glycopeptide antibiotics resistance protein